MERILATVEGTDPPQLAYLRSTADGKLIIAEVAAIIASDGLTITPDSYAQTLAYDSSGNLSTVTVTSALGNTYVQTLTYNASGQLTGQSKWVKQ